MVHRRRLHLCPDWEPTVPNKRVVVIRIARPRVALEIQIQADNVMEPESWKIQDLPRFEDHFVRNSIVGEFRELFHVGVGIIHFGMTR